MISISSGIGVAGEAIPRGRTAVAKLVVPTGGCSALALPRSLRGMKTRLRGHISGHGHVFIVPSIFYQVHEISPLLTPALARHRGICGDG